MIRNKYEIQFFGLQRSGNHGVITWLLQQFEQPQCFLNNVAHFEDPFEHYRNSDVPNMIPLSRGNIEQTRQQQKALLLYSYENLFLPDLRTRPLVKDAEHMLGVSEHCSQIIIIREFYNWIISRLKLYELVGQKINTVKAIDMLVDLWVVYAREYCGQTDFLNLNRTGILFDQWVVNEEYRLSILHKLGIAVRDNSNGKVPRGGGSSFNEDQGRAQVSKEGVLNRWQNADITSEVRQAIEAKVASQPAFESLYEEVMTGRQSPAIASA